MPPPTDDFLSTTSAVSIGGSATSNIEIANDTDWFKVTLKAAKTYRFDLRGIRMTAIITRES